MDGFCCILKQQLYKLSHFNFDDNFNNEVNNFIERHSDKSNVSKFPNESIIISRHGFLTSVELKFNDVKFVNFNNERRFVGRQFTVVVIVDNELVELN
jgi:hypothetical protein